MAYGCSVIIPVFNQRHEIIARAVRSALMQTLPPREVVVVDDRSPEDISAVINDFHDDRIRLLRHKENKGAAAARNTGAMAAQHEWLAFLDCDDEWHPEKLAQQLPGLTAAGPRVQAGVTGYIVQDLRMGETRAFHPDESRTTRQAILLGCRLSPGSTLAMARHVFEEIGPFDTTLRRLEDWDWLLRYIGHYDLGWVSSPLVTVFKSSNPSSHDLSKSIARLAAKHRAECYATSWRDGRRFDSALLFEEAAGAFHRRAWGKLSVLLMRSLFAFPLRNLSELTMLARRAGASRGGLQ